MLGLMKTFLLSSLAEEERRSLRGTRMRMADEAAIESSPAGNETGRDGRVLLDRPRSGRPRIFCAALQGARKELQGSGKRRSESTAGGGVVCRQDRSFLRRESFPFFFAGTRNEDRVSTPKTCVENRGTLADANAAASCTPTRREKGARLSFRKKERATERYAPAAGLA